MQLLIQPYVATNSTDIPVIESIPTILLIDRIIENGASKHKNTLEQRQVPNHFKHLSIQYSTTLLLLYGYGSFEEAKKLFSQLCTPSTGIGRLNIIYIYILYIIIYMYSIYIIYIMYYIYYIYCVILYYIASCI